MSEEAPPVKAGNAILALTKRKVFGVPVMLFVLVGAAVLLYFALRVKPAPDEPTDAAATDDGTDEFAGDQSNTGTGTPIFIAHPPPSDDTEPVDEVPEKSNADWAREAIGWLISDGNSPALSTSAVSKYLDGSALSMQERTLVDKVLVKFGAPPDGYVDAPPVGGGGTKNPGPPVKQGNPPTVHTVKGKADNNPNELSRLYYGREDAEAVRYIEANNTSLHSPYPAGSKVTIPRYRTPKYYKATAIVDTATEIGRKNGTTGAEVIALNPNLKFPVKAGTRVRVQ